MWSFILSTICLGDVLNAISVWYASIRGLKASRSSPPSKVFSLFLHLLHFIKYSWWSFLEAQVTQWSRIASASFFQLSSIQTQIVSAYFWMHSPCLQKYGLSTWRWRTLWIFHHEESSTVYVTFSFRFIMGDVSIYFGIKSRIFSSGWFIRISSGSFTSPYFPH